MRTPTRCERGAVSLEWAGLVAVAALVVGLIAASVAAPWVGANISAAVCKVLTLGQGQCAAAPAQETHKPTEPCTVAGNGYGVDLKVAAVATASGTTLITKERLSTGQYRVSLLTGQGGGAEVGAGWDARAEWDGGQWGWDIGANAGAELKGDKRTTYLVDSEQTADDIVSWSMYQGTRDTVTGAGSPSNPIAGWVSDQVIKPSTDWLADKAGLTPPPTPTSVTYRAGASANASLVVDWGVMGTKAEGGGTALLGVQQNSDGTTTDIGVLQGKLQLSGTAVIEKGTVGPDAAITYALHKDASGKPIDLQVVHTGKGDGTKSVETWTLPIKTDADRQAARTFLDNPIPTTWDVFYDAAHSRGTHSRVAYDTREGHEGKLAVNIEALAKVGGEVGLNLPSEKVTSAQYYDGSGWAPWDECR